MKHRTLLLAAALVFGASAGHAQGASASQAQLTAVAPAAATVQASSAEDSRLFAQALQLYRAGRWSAAYADFTTLAARGHARAARIALVMQHDGWGATPVHASAVK